MAAVSEQTRVNFNPEWMRTTYSASSKSGYGGGGMASSPPFGSGGAGNLNAYCDSGSAANNADSTVLAPPKLAKNRYGREEMLALFTGQAMVAPSEMKTTFPEFFIEKPQDPICMLPHTDTEERLLIQGGINSSKVINVVNHAERMRYGPPRSFGRGQEVAPGGQSPEITQQSGPPFISTRPAGYMGVGRGLPRGPYPSPGGFDQMTRPPSRFAMIGKGRGDGGRGRGLDRFAGGPGGFGGPPFSQPGVRFSENAGGGQNQNEEDLTPQNTRAQGLYDPNDPRDRPRQRQKSTSRTDDLDDSAAATYQPGQLRNVVSQRRSFTASVGQAVPEWAMDDDEEMDDNAVGTFDSSGQFQASNAPSQDTGIDASKQNPASVSKTGTKSVESVTATVAPSSTSSTNSSTKTASISTSAGVQKSSSLVVEPADKVSKSVVIGKSIPVETLFSNQAPVSVTTSASREQPLRDADANGGPPQNQNRRLPKTFAVVDQQLDAKGGSRTNASSTGPGPDSSGVGIGKLLGHQQPPVPPYTVQPQRQQRSAQQNVQAQPKFVVPKTISSSSDEVFTQLHEDVESLVNSFSADDMPSVVRTKKTNDPVPQRQPQHTAYGMPPSAGPLNVPQPHVASQLRNSGSSMTPQLERSESANATRNSLVGQQWCYTDPQGGLRGPFDSAQMAAWFAAGYFTMQLRVRRVEDTEFVPLGDLIKQYGRIPFVTSTSSSTADTPSPNPVSAASMVAAASLGSTDQSVIQPAARYGVAASMASSQNVPSKILGALTNHTGGGGAFHKTASARAMPTPASAATGGLWDMEFSSSHQLSVDQKMDEPVTPEIQEQLDILNQMLKKEREEEMKRRAEDEERQRKIAEAREAARREEEHQKALLKQKQEELRQLQEAKAEAERRRKEAEEEEAKRLREKKILEEQQQRLEQLAKKDEEERRKRALEEERQRKELEAKEAAEKKKREEEERKAAAALRRQQEEQLRLEQERKKQQQRKAAAAPWASAAQQSMQQHSKNGVPIGKDGSKSLTEIQKEEERQFIAERRQEMELDMQRRQNMTTASAQFGSAWGGSTVASKLKWESQPAPKQHHGTKSASAWGGTGEVQNFGGHGLWDDDDSPPASPLKTRTAKAVSTQQAKTNSKAAGQAKGDSLPTTGISSKKEQNVKRIFQTQQSGSDEFTSWCIKQINGFSKDIDALTFVAFLKEVETPSEVEDYIISYFGDNRHSREFTKQFVEKRNGLRKATSSAKSQADDLCTPAPALNPVKVSENLAPNVNEKTGGGGKKKKSGKSAGRIVDCSILGFKATADPNRLNAGEIDNPL